MRLLFVSDAIYPLSDVPLARFVSALGDALATLGHHVVVVSPLQSRETVERLSMARRLTPVTIDLPEGQHAVTVYDGRLPSGVNLWALEHDLFSTSTSVEARILASMLVARSGTTLAADDAQSSGPWHVLHGFGVAGALAAYLAPNTKHLELLKTTLSVDDLDGRLRVGPEWIERLGLPPEDLAPQGPAVEGELDPIKVGIERADQILFPGPSMVLDAQRDHASDGLDELIRDRLPAISSLLPGLDVTRWTPASDALLPVRYDPESREGKASCKSSLQNRAGLPVAPRAPLVALLPPCDSLVDALGPSIERVLRAEAQVVAPAGISAGLDVALDAAKEKWPRQVGRLGETEADLHLLLGGADLVILDAPTAHDAEHLLAAMRYGALPIVPAVGVARDLVVDLTASLESGNGFLLHGEPPSIDETRAVLLRACDAIRRRKRLDACLTRVMGQNVSWEHRAKAVEQLYGALLR